MLNTIQPCDVLIVDDEFDIADACRDMVKALGVTVAIASTLKEGSRQLKFTPRILILDLGLPDGGGIQLLKRVRSSGAKIKVAIISGNTTRDAVTAVVPLKPEAFFRKPFDAMKLQEWVKTNLRQAA